MLSRISRFYRTVTTRPAGEGPEPMHYLDIPVKFRSVPVISAGRISETMVRVTVGGAEAEDFESHVFDEHVKFVFPDPETGELRLPTRDDGHLDWPKPFPTTREYTVRKFRPEAGEVDFDFVAHEGGLAAEWALRAQPGDILHVAGPPGAWVVAPDYDTYVLVGDETAAPAILRFVEEVPADSPWRVEAIIEVPGPGSEQEVETAAGTTLTWLHRAAGQPSGLEAAARVLDLSDAGRVYAWLAGEAGDIKPLRSWIRKDLGLAKGHFNVTGYWKRGKADTHVHYDL